MITEIANDKWTSWQLPMDRHTHPHCILVIVSLHHMDKSKNLSVDQNTWIGIRLRIQHGHDTVLHNRAGLELDKPLAVALSRRLSLF